MFFLQTVVATKAFCSLSDWKEIVVSSKRVLAYGSCFGEYIIRLVNLLMMDTGNFSTTASHLVSSFSIPALFQ